MNIRFNLSYNIKSTLKSYFSMKTLGFLPLYMQCCYGRGYLTLVNMIDFNTWHYMIDVMSFERRHAKRVLNVTDDVMRK